MWPDRRRAGFALPVFLVGVALASAGQDACAGPGMPAAGDAVMDGESTGVRPVAGIVPATMRVGGSKGRAARCLAVVEVVDPPRACQTQDCVKVFPSRRTQTLVRGQRALLASACRGAKNDARPNLLWGSSSVLVLQDGRTGAGIWTPVQAGGAHAARLETEGSFGTLTWSSAGFVWRESPN